MRPQSCAQLTTVVIHTLRESCGKDWCKIFKIAVFTKPPGMTTLSYMCGYMQVALDFVQHCAVLWREGLNHRSPCPHHRKGDWICYVVMATTH